MLAPFTIEATNTEVLNSKLKFEKILRSLTAVNAPFGWEFSKGEDVIVAVLDTGIYKNHPGFGNRVIDGRNFTPEYNADPLNYSDNQGHGTHVAGIVAGQAVNNIYVGMAPKAKLIIGKVALADGTTPARYSIDAIDWVTNWRGPNNEKVDIINYSILIYPNTAEATDAELLELRAAIQRAVDAGITFICAAGNEGDGNDTTNELGYPAGWSETVSVGAVDMYGKISYFSNSNSEVDIAAVGSTVTSFDQRTDGFATVSGTSQATPQVAGAAALIRSMYKKLGTPLTNAETIAKLKLATKVVAESATEVGVGMLDMSKAEYPVKATLNPLENELPYIANDETNAVVQYMNPRKLWEVTRGRGMVTAILGTGVNVNDPRIKGKVLAGRNFSAADSGNPDIFSEPANVTEGTNAAARIAGRQTWNRDGLMGIAPDSHLIVGKVYTLAGNGGPVQQQVNAIDWAVNWQGPNGEIAKVILLNWFGETASDATVSAAIARAKAAGRIVVAGGGFQYQGTNLYPARYDDVVAVQSVAYTGTYKEGIRSTTGVSSINQNYFLSAPASNETNVYEAPAYAAGAIGLIIKAYEKFDIPIPDVATLKTELKAFLRPFVITNQYMYDASYFVGHGILDIAVAETPFGGTKIIEVEPEPDDVVSNTESPTATKTTVSYNSVGLLWDYEPATGDHVWYEIWRNDNEIEPVGEVFSTPSFKDRSVKPETTYNYEIVVRSAVNGIVARSNVVTVTTPEGADPIVSNTTAPLTALGVITYDSVPLLWSYIPTEDDIVSYVVKRNGVELVKIKSQSFVDYNVEPETAYTYSIEVHSEQNDFVVKSADIVVTTSEAPYVEPKIEIHSYPAYVYVDKASGEHITVLGQIKPEYVREMLKLPSNVDPTNKHIISLMAIAKDFIMKNTFLTMEELDTMPTAIGVFSMLVADLYFERTTTNEAKESKVYQAMLKSLQKVVV